MPVPERDVLAMPAADAVAQRVEHLVDSRPGVVVGVQRDPVHRIHVDTHPRRPNRVDHPTSSDRVAKRDELVALQVNAHARLGRNLGSLAQRVDQIGFGPGLPVVGMRRPGTGRAHAARAGVNTGRAQPASQAQTGAQHLHAAPPSLGIRMHQVLPVTGGHVVIQARVGQDLTKAAAVGVGRRIKRIVSTQPREHAGIAPRTQCARRLRRQVPQVVGQQGTGDSQAHDQPPPSTGTIPPDM